MDTLFQKIIKREIESEIFYEDKVVIAIMDINPVNKGHFLVIPKEYSKNLNDIDDKVFKYLLFKSKQLAKKMIREMNVSGFKLIINNGEEAGQEIMHTHVHIIPSEK